MGAIAVHHTGTSDAAWDAGVNEKRLRSGEDGAYYARMYAWRDPAGDETTKAAYKFPHHEVSEGGDPGAANLAGCSAGIAVLNGGRGGANIPDGDRAGVYSHLAAHLRDGGKEPPELMQGSGSGPGGAERVRLAAAGANRTRTLNREARTFRAIALSGEPIPRYDALSGGEFLLKFDPAGANLARIEAGTAPLLNAHSEADLASKLGYVSAAEWQGPALIVECKLGTSPAAEQVLNDLAAGIPAAISLGVLLREWQDRPGAEGRLAERLVTSWEIYEASIVPVPADASAVTLSFERGNMTLSSENQTVFDARAAATEIGARLGLGADFVERASTAKSAAEVRGLAQNYLVERYNQAPTRSQVAVLHDEGDTRREGLTLALTHRLRGGEPDERAKPYLHLRLPDAARECLRWRGSHLAGMSDARVVNLAMSTSDFPNILANVGNKTLLEAYQATPAVLKAVCRITTAADFKERRVLRFGEGSGLQQKAEGGSYVYGSIAEQSSSYSIRTYGRIFAMTREMIVNDDLGALDQFFRAAGRLAVEFEGRMLVDLLTANGGLGPVLSDGKTLFHTDHGNLAASGGAISVSTLDVARAALRRQKGLDGAVIIDANPRYLVVPVSKQAVAEQVTAAITPAQPADVNPFAGRLTALADPHLDDASTTAWYLAADPANVPVFEFAYLEGAQGPQTEQQTDFDTDTLKFKVRLDVGAGAVDWRGIYRNPGA
jgi:hypothetical protein